MTDDRGAEIRAKIAAAARLAADRLAGPPQPDQGNRASSRPSGKRRSSKGEGVFALRDGWIQRAVDVEDPDTNKVRTTWRRVCSELEVLALTRDDAGESWGRLLKVIDRDGVAHEWAAPAALFAGSGETLRAELLSLGLEIGTGRYAKADLAEYILGAEPAARARCVGRVGWHGDRFVLPDTAIGPGAATETMVLQAEQRLDHAFATCGDLDRWQAGVAAPAVGNSRLLLAISAAFAAPLLGLVGFESGGFHLRGGSSTGKTSALVAGASVWGGGGVRGYVRTWRATSNALEFMCAAHCDALLCLDELGQLDGRDAGSAAYLIAQGRSKARAGRDGGARRSTEWRTLFLSSGELSLADKMAEAGQRGAAGMSIRVIDLRADAGADMGLFQDLHGAPNPAAFAQSITSAAREHYGHAARAFLEAVTSDPDAACDFVREVTRAFLRASLPEGSDGQVRRAADRFALVAAAGELAGAYGVAPWAEGAASAGAVECFRAWISDRGGTGSGELAEAQKRLRAFIDANARARFEAWHGESGRAIILNRCGYVRRDVLPDNTTVPPEYFLLPSAFAEILVGMDVRGLARELVKVGALVGGKDGAPTAAHRVPAEGGDPKRLYRVGAEWLRAGSDDG